MVDLIILGSGMAGLTAAIYAARAGLKPVLVAGPEEGGQLTLTTTVENFPGFPDGVQGPELTERMTQQAEKFGTIIIRKNAKSFSRKGAEFEIGLGDESLHTRAVIIATGATAKMIGLDSEKRLLGRGVSTCATCDGFFYKGKDVAVIGGGDSACEDAIYLTKFAQKVTLVHRRDSLRASKIMRDRVLTNEKITLMWNSIPKEILGDEKGVKGVILEDVNSNETSTLECDGVFVAIGHNPNTELFKGILELDAKGFIVTDKRSCTKVPGIFAAGDVQDPIYKQAITAAGSGCQAALEAERYLDEKKIK